MFLSEVRIFFIIDGAFNKIDLAKGQFNGKSFKC
jgi:hypothetical protein